MPRIIGKNFPIFLGSWEEFDEIQFHVFLKSEMGNTFLKGNRNSTQLKGIVPHDEGELNANYPKMLRFTHKFGGKIDMNFL